MNYLHNIVDKLMKDKGIKPFEMFHIRCDNEKMDYKLAESLRPLTVGYFTDTRDFKIPEGMSSNKTSTAKAESILIANILNGNIDIEPVCAFFPEKGERYYYLVATNNAHPERTTPAYAEWGDTLEDFARYEINNCFRSEAEAMKSATFYTDTAEFYRQKLEKHKDKAFYNVA